MDVSQQEEKKVSFVLEDLPPALKVFHAMTFLSRALSEPTKWPKSLTKLKATVNDWTEDDLSVLKAHLRSDCRVEPHGIFGVTGEHLGALKGVVDCQALTEAMNAYWAPWTLQQWNLMDERRLQLPEGVTEFRVTRSRAHNGGWLLHSIDQMPLQ